MVVLHVRDAGYRALAGSGGGWGGWSGLKRDPVGTSCRRCRGMTTTPAAATSTLPVSVDFQFGYGAFALRPDAPVHIVSLVLLTQLAVLVVALLHQFPVLLPL